MLDLSYHRTPLALNSEIRSDALRKLGIFNEDRGGHTNVGNNFSAVLSLDGGGFHILWTLQLLKELEIVASDGLPTPVTCGDLFDVITGTSAGAITAVLMVRGWSAERIETFWLNEYSSSRLYPYRNPFLGASLDMMRRLRLNFPREVLFRLAWFMDAPIYDKREIRRLTEAAFGDKTMGQLCEEAGRGLFLLNKDTKSGYILPLGCVINHDPEPDQERVYGYLNSVDLRVSSVLEAATSPPLLMRPFGPFLDAGYGSFNNPVLITFAAINDIIQIINDDAYDPTNESNRARLTRLSARLRHKYLSGFSMLDSKPRTAAFSFGTAFSSSIPLPEWLSRNPLVPGYTWINWYVSDVQKESANLQDAFLSSRNILPAVDFRRFNMSFSSAVFRQLEDLSFGDIPGIAATSLHELTDEDVFYVTALLEPAFMRIYQTLGRAVVRYMYAQTDRVRKVFHTLNDELIDYRPNLDVWQPALKKTRRNELEGRLARSLGSREWSREQPSGRTLASYFSLPLPDFKAPFFQSRSPFDRG